MNDAKATQLLDLMTHLAQALKAVDGRVDALQKELAELKHKQAYPASEGAYGR